ncbi:hypothetical protein [Hahella ganghwensis]|uniref:hypothetical protein n=1 Tax=Hahella ganghwensis TaxID=286420 RepID=UPI000476C028|nr:hypothetical protein [Hahella ganghwensis]
MHSNDFDIDTALQAAQALQKVLAARTHKKKIWGQEIVVPGQLGEALKLPTLISQLSSKVGKRREKGLEQFRELWDTLSEATRQEVLHAIGWYDPEDLDWEDKRSNRRPSLPGED